MICACVCKKGQTCCAIKSSFFTSLETYSELGVHGRSRREHVVRERALKKTPHTACLCVLCCQCSLCFLCCRVYFNDALFLPFSLDAEKLRFIIFLRLALFSHFRPFLLLERCRGTVGSGKRHLQGLLSWHVFISGRGGLRGPTLLAVKRHAVGLFVFLTHIALIFAIEKVFTSYQ